MECIAAIATVFMAIFTGCLCWSTKKLWKTTTESVKATEKAADAAQKSANAIPIAERAYLFVEVKREEYVPKGVLEYGNDRTISIDILIRNHGRTPAIISESLMNVQYPIIFPDGDLEKIYLANIPPSIVIASEKPFKHTSQIKIPMADMDRIDRGDVKLECRGEIKYKDIFKKEHRTWFTWYWDHNINGFRISNFEYNNGYD
jgi:hypothetical protein